MAGGVVPSGIVQSVMVSATLSLFAIPFLGLLGQKLAARRIETRVDLPAAALQPPDSGGQVLLVGFGCVGRLVGEMLAEHDQSFVALDTDPGIVAGARREGLNVHYGDAGRREMLELCNVATARALVVTMDAPGKVDEVVQAARALRKDLIIIARARDDRHAVRLYGYGVTDAVPETTEASLQLAENTLVDLGVPMGLVLASIHAGAIATATCSRRPSPKRPTAPTGPCAVACRPRPPAAPIRRPRTRFKGVCSHFGHGSVLKAPFPSSPTTATCMPIGRSPNTSIRLIVNDTPVSTPLHA
ncbi:NAD-binding protein [Brevundimonas sp.]|uniref:NAD-binding protein n=1 Tax=Brevundimonas sp. TaxID=1871086 RepID=UPI00342E17B9